MTHVFIKRGSLETDVHKKKAPCEDEGRALQDKECQKWPERLQWLGEARLGVPLTALGRSQPCRPSVLDFQSDWGIVPCISVPWARVLFIAVSANLYI